MKARLADYISVLSTLQQMSFLSLQSHDDCDENHRHNCDCCSK